MIGSLQSKIIQLTSEQLISFLTNKIAQLESNYSALQDKVELLTQREVISNQRIEVLEKENENLREELSRYKIKKDSSNSSMPPSSDMNNPIRNKSLREKSGKKAGGQHGHKGKTLEFRKDPDEVIEHIPKTCDQCGIILIDTQNELIESRQVFDIPPIKVICTEHRIFSNRCNCGHINCGVFPITVKSMVQYGCNMEATIAYMHTRQFMPYDRMREYFECVMNLEISTGGINHILQRFVSKCKPIYDALKVKVEAATNLGCDETGAKVNKEKGWFWTWQNKFFTYIAFSSSRGFDTIESLFKNGLLNAILNHDCWAAQFKCKAKGHQVCTSHLLRDLVFLFELYNNDWAIKFKELIKEAIELKNILKPSDYINPIPQRDKLERRLTRLLKQEIPKKCQKLITFQNRGLKYRDSILLFLYYEEVPPDNNGSERAIRNIKVKQKVSGQFRSEKGASDFAILRSIVDTTIKSGKEVFGELLNIANLTTE